MVSRIGFFSILAVAMAISACSSAQDDAQPAVDETVGATGTTLVPVPDHVADGLCSLKRGSTERELIALYGEPDERNEGPGMTLLRWRKDAWHADAMFSDGQLQTAGAYAVQDGLKAKNTLGDHPEWAEGKTKLEEMERTLGPGTRVAVQWHKGIDVAASIRSKPDFDASILRDRCSDRYGWPGLKLGVFASLRFADGVLQGGL